MNYQAIIKVKNIKADHQHSEISEFEFRTKKKMLITLICKQCSGDDCMLMPIVRGCVIVAACMYGMISPHNREC